MSDTFLGKCRYYWQSLMNCHNLSCTKATLHSLLMCCLCRAYSLIGKTLINIVTGKTSQNITSLTIITQTSQIFTIIVTFTIIIIVINFHHHHHYHNHELSSSSSSSSTFIKIISIIIIIINFHPHSPESHLSLVSESLENDM